MNAPFLAQVVNEGLKARMATASIALAKRSLVMSLRAAIAFMLYCLMMVAAVLLLVFVILPTLDSGGIDGKFAFMISAAILILAWCAVMSVAHMIKHYVNRATRDELDTVKLPKKEVRGSLSA